MRKRINRRISLLVVIAMLLALWPSFQSQAQNMLSPLTSPATPGSATATVGLPTPIGTPGANFTPISTPNEPSSPGPNQPPPTATPYVDPHLPSLVTKISFSPNPVSVGDTVAVTITVINQAPDQAQNLVVTMPLPAGVVIAGQGQPSVGQTPSPGATPAPSPTPGGPITWNLPTLAGNSSATFSTNLRLIGLSAGKALTINTQVIAARLSSPDVASAGALVVDHSGGAASTQFTPGNAATLHSSDNQVVVNFPAAAYTSPLTLTHSFQPPAGTSAPPSIAGWKRGFGTFYLTATDNQGQSVHQFAQPVTITVGYNQAQLQALDIREPDLTLYWYDDTQQMWEAVPTKVNPATQTASAQVTHFSDYQLGDNTSASSVYLPNLQGGRTDLFTGAASYSIPIDVPAGPAGLRPNLSLSYNSAATDGRYGQRRYQQASWVGKGWSLDTGSISLGIIQGDIRGVPYLYYSLVQNGQSYDLVGTCHVNPDPSYCSTNYPTQWDWHTANENFSKILPVQVADSTINFYDTTPYHRFKWDVWAKDGTMYEYAQDDWWGFDNSCDNGGNSFMQPYKWNLTMVQDVDGNVIKYNYNDAFQSASACHAHGVLDQDVWPTTITWGGAPFSGNSPRYQVTFVSSGRGTVDTQFDNASNAMGSGPHETRQLNNIQVQSNYTGSNWDLVRQYNLNYASSGLMLSDSWTCVLDSLGITRGCAEPRRYQSDPTVKLTLASVQVVGNAGGLLPATTFTYGNSPGDGTNQYPLGAWNRLTAISNGQNGAVTFAYDNIGQVVSDSAFINNRRVNQRTLDPAVNNPAGHKYTYSYSYQHPAYNWLRHGSDLYPNSAALYNASQYGQGFQLAHQSGTLFRGHSQVTETAPDGTQTTHSFYQGDAGCTDLTQNACFQAVRDNEVFVGKEWHSLVVSSATQGSHNLKEETNTFQDNFNSPLYPFNGLWNSFSFESQNLAGDWGDNGGGTWISKTKTTNYYYDPSLQGGTQYGNLTQMNEYNASGTLVRYTTDQYAVISNTTYYVVNRRDREDTYNGAGQHVALTFYLYDGNDQSLGQLGGTVGGHPSYGHITRQMQFFNVPFQGDLANVQLYSQDSSYSYDQYGNQTGSTYYLGSGQSGGAGMGMWMWNGSSWYWNLNSHANDIPATTYTDYDGVFHAFVTQVRQPQVYHPGGNVTLTTSYNYDWVHGTKIQVTDPNLNATTMQYDQFNRITALIKPGDSPQYPTEWWVYHDGEVPVRYEHDKREYANSGDYLPIQSFYDGMGQEIQTKTEDQWYGYHENIIVSKNYNANPGQVTSKSQPLYWRSDDTTFWQYQTPSGVVSTTTSYDGLGRVWQVQQPDTTRTNYAYTVVASGPATTVTDPNGIKKRTEYDTLGRMTSVVELNPDGSTYTSTSYVYSPLHNLLTAIINYNGVSNFTTSASYDSLGRRTQSVDPDRGIRNYTYDVNSNPIQESDSRNQTVYHAYDELNRLRQTTYSANGTPATYQYDQGTGNWGYRTTMTRQTSPDVISTTWTYDIRGRVAHASYWAGGRGPYIYAYSYNSGDQVNTLNLASGGEVLSYGYDAAWRPYSLSSSLSDVSVQSTYYTALDQSQNMTYGNGVTEIWNYSAPMQRLSRIRVGTISNFGSIYDHSYTQYDNDGNIQTIVDNNAGSTQNFSYDQRNRLQLWTKTGMANQSYGYDPMGNLTNNAGVGYTYHSGGACSGPHQLCNDGGNSYSYDANGNQTSTGRSYNWNADNQLASYVQGSYSESYSYDADGERAMRTAGSVTTIYLGPLFELDVQSSNHQQTITRRTFYKMGSQLVAQRSMVDSSLIYLHTDHLGSIVRATNASATTAYSYEYDPWGNVTASGGITQTLLSYTGLHRDLSLYYDHARYYDAAISHFNSADTIIPGIRNPQNLNRYSYVTNNPVNLTDPTGHSACPESLGRSCSPSGEGRAPSVPGCQSGTVGCIDPSPAPINLNSCIAGVICQANNPGIPGWYFGQPFQIVPPPSPGGSCGSHGFFFGEGWLVPGSNNTLYVSWHVWCSWTSYSQREVDSGGLWTLYLGRDDAWSLPYWNYGECEAGPGCGKGFAVTNTLVTAHNNEAWSGDVTGFLTFSDGVEVFFDPVIELSYSP
ncbi:MAG: hypothetical protein DLM69_01455 [Candidatus Chloroheliales bacterium]|nr:MAG: hypothetical protein DLM69_01455 [Chloroflexota bacterium]